MKKAVIIVVVLCVLGVVAFLALRGRFSENPTEGGFRDWVKNPDYKRSAEEYFAERDALTVPDDNSFRLRDGRVVFAKNRGAGATNTCVCSGF